VNTQRTIMLIVLAVMLAGIGAAALMVWWLGWLIGIVAALGAVLLLLILYLLVIRPWHLRWGSTDAEVARAMPGDDLVPDASVSSRAITIRGEPDEIWPWLLQLGWGRGGWYSYDWIDNDGEPSADRIVPELQDLKVGDEILMMPGMGPRVVSMDPNRALVSAADDGTTSWCLGLYPIEGGGTRLVSRWRIDFEVTPASAFFIALSEPGAFIMEQKMLRVIRDRVEGR
jgi:hypothetical protein